MKRLRRMTDFEAARKDFGIEEHVGRWWLNGGEITAPLWSPSAQRNVYPPWWPFYRNPRTNELVYLGR